MEIREITAGDAAFTGWFDVYRQAFRADYPDGPRWHEHEFKVIFEPHEHKDVKLWLVIDGDDHVGAASLVLPLRDNLTLGEPDIYVRPDVRRRGIGTALLDVIQNAARECGRTMLMTYVEGPVGPEEAIRTPGTGFAEHHGFTKRITEIARVQRPPFLLDEIAAAEAEAKEHAVGYEIVMWRGHAPDDHIDEYARLEGRLSTDAPLGDMEYEAEVWDEARIRKAEERYVRMGRTTWNAAAIAPDGTTMAGLTRISLAVDSDDTGFQDTTIVDPEHRGHRLGLLLKAANFMRLYHDRPGVQSVWTWNAASNKHMIAINQRLGYQVEGWSAAYQRAL